MVTLEQQADELLLAEARRRGVSLRKLGVIDTRRQRTISAREFPASEVAGRFTSRVALMGWTNEEED